MPISEQAIERSFALIEEAALKGERAPQGHPHGPLGNGTVTALYRTGRIRGAIYQNNWRVLTILTGPNAGKSTASPPTSGRPHLIIDRNSVSTPSAGIGKPSAPRMMTSAEIRKIAP